METRHIPIIVVATLLAVAATACGGAPAVEIPPTPTPSTVEPTQREQVVVKQPTALGGTLSVRANRDMASFDAHYAISALDNTHNQRLYSVLVKQQDRGPIRPDLAERWEVQDNGTKYIFHLRKDVRYHDGRQLTAKDAVYSLNRVMGRTEEKKKSDRTGLLDFYIKNLQARDDYTVEVELLRPAVVFLEMLTSGYGSVIPAGTVAADLRSAPKGSGPWMLKEWVKGSHVLYEKNPNFYEKGVPYLDAWRNWIIPDPAAYEAAFLTKKIDVGGCSTLECHKSTDAMEARGELIKHRSVGQGLTGLGFNLRQGVKGPWMDRRVRHAMYLVFDHEALIATVRDGMGVFTGILSSGTSWGRPPEYWAKQPGYRKPKDQDIAEARGLMAQAGYPNGFEVEMQTRSDLPDHAKESELWVHQLALLGIKAKIVIRDATDIFDRAAQGRYEIWEHGWAFFTTDPDELLGIHFQPGASRNYFGYDRGADWNTLFRQMSQELDPAKRREMTSKLEDMVMEDHPVIPLPQGLGSAMWWPYVQNWNPGWNSYVDSRKDYVWIDPTKR